MSESLDHENSKAALGFWIYILSDCVLFASLFATYAVLRGNTANGPSAHELFDLPFVLVETLILLTSSLTSGIAMLSALKNDKDKTLLWFSATFLLGVAFIAMELTEFGHLLSEGHSYTSSAFLSAFFTLVGTHGVHILVGLLWMGVLMYRIAKHGLAPATLGKLRLLSTYWHFLDIIWIFIFTIVYLLGSIK